MVKSPFDFFQIEMKVLLGHSTVMIKPVLGIRPESFDAVEVVPALGFALFLLDDHMIAPNIQERISVPIIGIVEAPCFGVTGHERDKFSSSSAGNGKGQNLAIPLIETEDHPFSGGTPTPLAGHSAAKQGLIHLDLARELRELFHGLTV